MAIATAVRLPDELAERYKRLALATGRTKTYYMTKALAEAIDRLEFEYGVLQTLEEVRSGEQETYTADEVLEMLEGDDADR